MKRLLLVVSFLFALSSFAMAAETDFYLGVEAGVAWHKLKDNAKVSGYGRNDSISASASETESALLLGLKGGLIFNKTHRLSAAYRPNIHSDAYIHSFLALYDYLIPVSDVGRIYIGVNAGATIFDYDDDLPRKLGISESDLDMSGFEYGAQAGFIYDLYKNIELEFGLGYTRYEVDETYYFDYRINSIRIRGEAELELEDRIYITLGFNCKF